MARPTDDGKPDRELREAPRDTEPAAADPDAAYAEARRLRAGGRGAEARRLFASALAGYEQKLGAKVAVGVPMAAYTDGVSAAAGRIAIARDTEILIYDTTTWAPLRRLVHEAGDRIHVRALALAPDGKTLAAAYGTTGIELWDVERGTRVRTLRGHTKPVGLLAWSTDGKTIVSASESVRTWDAASGQPIREVAIKDATVMTIASAGGPGDVILTGSFTGQVSVIDLARGQLVRTIPGPKGTISKLEVRGKTLAVSYEDSPNATVHLFDLASGRRTRSFALIAHGTLSPDGKRLAGSFETGMQIIDLARGVPVVSDKQLFQPQYLADGTLLALDAEGGVLAVDPSGRSTMLVPTARSVSRLVFGLGGRIATRSRQGLELCDLGPRLDCREITGSYRDVAFGNQTLAAIRDDDGSVERWNATLVPGSRLLTNPPDHMIPQHNNLIAMSRDGWRAVTSEYRLHVLDLVAGTELHAGKKLDGHNSLAISPDGKLAATSWSGARLYDLDTGATVAGLPISSETLAFSADSRYLAGAVGSLLEVTEIGSTAHESTTLPPLGKHDRVKALAFSHTGSRLIVGYGNQGRILALPGLRPLAVLEGHRLPVFGVAVRPDDRVIATASSDGLTRLWSLDGKPLAELGFVGADAAYVLDPGHHHVELAGAASRWLTCDVGAISFPFELCADRVTVPGLASTAAQVDLRVALAPLPAIRQAAEATAPAATYKRLEDVVFQGRPSTAAVSLIERTRYHAWFSADGKTVLTTGGSDGSIIQSGQKAKLDVADGFEITLSPDGSRASIVQARAPLSVVDVPSGKRVWQHQHGLGCAARWASPTVLIAHDDGNDGYLWRIDLATGKATQLGGKRRADACWASADGKRWFVRDDFAKRGGVVWKIDGTTGAATIWLESVSDLVGTRDADRLCYTRGNAVFCRADGGAEERVVDEGYNLQLDDTGHTLLFATRGIFFAADTGARTVRAISNMSGRSGAVQAVLSGGDIIVGGGSTGVDVFDLRTKTRSFIPGGAFYGVRAIPGRPRSFTIEKEVNNLQDLYLAELR